MFFALQVIKKLLQQTLSISNYIHVKRQQRLRAVWLKIEAFEEFRTVLAEQCRFTAPISQQFH